MVDGCWHVLVLLLGVKHVELGVVAPLPASTVPSTNTLLTGALPPW